MAELTGTGWLADDLYLMAHHEVTGKPFLQPRATGLGLAGALLAELVVTGAILARPGAVVVSPAPPPERLGRTVLGVIAGERQPHPARDWLAYLAPTAADQVAWRLAQAGYVVPARTRWRRTGRWVPVDADCAFAPLARVHSVLGSPSPVTTHGTVLGGLALACGLGSHLALYLPPRARTRLDQAVTGLSADLREVITQTRAAVDSAVLAHRV